MCKNLISILLLILAVPATAQQTQQNAHGSQNSDAENGNSISPIVQVAPAFDLITVGRFDRMNLFTSSINKNWYLFDNTQNRVVAGSEFKGAPVAVQASVDGKSLYRLSRYS